MEEMNSRKESGGGRWVFVATICVGSFLLFLVQPMIARMALPRLGGAPTVWNSAMLVYQGLLLIGYAYAHWIGGRSPQLQRWAHLGVFALAALTLPIGLSAQDMPANANPVLWVPWLLLSSIGPLFLAVSAQAPLMQKWFSLSGGQNPYPLYAASNLGSFGGLISYPLLVEPLVSVEQQRWLWSAGFVVLMFLILICGRLLPRVGADATIASEAHQSPKPTARTATKWVLLAAIPSGLMLSTSLHLTTDIVAMPLLWVLPLGLYLLSFSVAFATNRTFADWCIRLAPYVLIVTAAGTFLETGDWALLFAGIMLLNLFLVSVALHSRMFDSRPAPEHLTRFYLYMSLGGVVGGIVCALIAPIAFNWAIEHPLLLATAAFALHGRPVFTFVSRWFEGSSSKLVPTLLVLLLVLGLSNAHQANNLWSGAITPVMVAAAFIIAIALAVVGKRAAFAGTLVGLMLLLGGWEKLSLGLDPGKLTRSYFGIYTVMTYDNKSRGLIHGTTVHGLQQTSTGKETEPTTYYAPLSGVGLAMQNLTPLFGNGASVSVVGLGVGTMACYAKPDQTWRFYEIDPAIVRIAQDASRFTFLNRCTPRADVLVGDARLVIANQPAEIADALVIDAFSSDSVPMHLLTREAFEIYGRHLRKKGILMVHISNRYLDLRPVVAAATRNGWTAMIRSYEPEAKQQQNFYTKSLWVALSRDPKTLEQLEAGSPAQGWKPLNGQDGIIQWTDDYASILQILL